MSEPTPYPRAAAEREESEPPPEAALTYSGWWRRAGALLVDTLLLWAIAAVLIGLTAAVGAVDETAGLVLLIAVIVALVAGPIFYYIYFTGREPGQTVGKRALGIRVRHAERDNAIGYGRAAGRYAITFVFSFFWFLVIPILLDYLWPLWDERNQTLHDKAVNSVVVRA